jgi:hypothetical protein
LRECFDILCMALPPIRYNTAIRQLAVSQLAKKCAANGSGLRRVQVPPAHWFPPPEGNRSRLFLSDEKLSLLEVSLRAAGWHRSSVAGGFERLFASAIITNGNAGEIRADSLGLSGTAASSER